MKQRFGGFGRLLTLPIVLALAMTALPGSVYAADRTDSAILSWTDDPATTQTVVWRDAEKADCFVQYVTEVQHARTGFEGAAQIAAECRDISLDATGAWHYEATMTGLSPATRYVYRVGNEAGWSGEASFTTADTQTESFSFVYMGDIQVVNNAQEEFALWGELAQAAYEKAPDLAFGLLGGDIVESGISVAQFDYFMESASPVFSNLPIMPTNGNHESNFPSGKPELYLDVYALPENGPEGFSGEFYSFDYGNCHVTVLNSWVFSGEQALDDEDYQALYDWVENDLRTSDATWKIMLTHLPVYPVHSDTNADAMRESWAPLFEEYGVSLFLVGHQHVYSRSYPMYEGGIDYENGIVQIMGAAGQKFYSSADERYSERTIYDVATYQLIRIDGNTLTVQTYDIDGNELDYCILSPRTCASVYYSDVSGSEWYYEASEYVRKTALIDPLNSDQFSADTATTRQTLVEALYRLSDSPQVTGTSPFSDAAAPAVIWAYENGIVNGVSETAFAPNSSVTREQIAAILYRYVQYKGGDLAARADTSKFSDAAQISDWAADALCWANGMALINGTNDGRLAPTETATRAQVAQILFNMEGMG